VLNSICQGAGAEGANTRDRSWGPALMLAVRELVAMQTSTSARIVALVVVLGVGAADTSVGGHWTLTFEDEFDGTTVNRTRWSVANGGAHGANELELYIAEDVWVANGALTIRTRYNPTSCVVPNASRTPGPSDGHRLDTEAHFSQRYGRFAVRAKLPNVLAPNVWPAHWLLPDQTSPGCIGTLGKYISPQLFNPCK
jgi:beta-glucanase (GH16 family)